VGEWIGDRFDSQSDRGVPAFAALPGGDVLAVARNGAYVMHPDGGVRRVGSFTEAGWSPHGMYVVGVRGRRLAAVDPDGNTRWTVVRPRPVHHPAWSGGNGFRVAYLEAGSLRVVAGDGTGDRPVRTAAAPVTPAWRPGAAWVLTYAGPGGLIETVDVDTRRRLWSRRAGAPPVALDWTRDGRRMVALFPGSLRVYDRYGRPLTRRRLEGGRALALDPGGRRAAVAVAGRGGTRVLTVPLRADGRPRSVFDGLGRVEGIDWSPDGHRLLLAWRDADQWLLLGPGRRVRALSDVSGELGASAGFPRVAGWCCSR